MGRNNVREVEANNRMGVYTSCTNNVIIRTHNVWYLLGVIE